MRIDKIILAIIVIENNLEEKWISTRGDNDEVYSSDYETDGEFNYDKYIGKVLFNIKSPASFCEKEGIK